MDTLSSNLQTVCAKLEPQNSSRPYVLFPLSTHLMMPSVRTFSHYILLFLSTSLLSHMKGAKMTRCGQSSWMCGLAITIGKLVSGFVDIYLGANHNLSSVLHAALESVAQSDPKPPILARYAKRRTSPMGSRPRGSILTVLARISSKSNKLCIGAQSGKS